MLDDEMMRLRPLEKEDLLTLHGWENLSRFWRSSSTLAPYSLRNVMRYLDEYEADPFHQGQLRLMIERKEPRTPLGIVELYEVEVRHRRANVGLLIDPLHQRRHVATRALDLLHGYCADHLMLHQLLAYVPQDNYPSRALFSGAGYTHVATLPHWLCAPGGEWTDTLVFQRYL